MLNLPGHQRSSCFSCDLRVQVVRDISLDFHNDKKCSRCVCVQQSPSTPQRPLGKERDVMVGHPNEETFPQEGQSEARAVGPASVDHNDGLHLPSADQEPLSMLQENPLHDDGNAADDLPNHRDAGGRDSSLELQGRSFATDLPSSSALQPIFTTHLHDDALTERAKKDQKYPASSPFLPGPCLLIDSGCEKCCQKNPQEPEGSQTMVAQPDDVGQPQPVGSGRTTFFIFRNNFSFSKNPRGRVDDPRPSASWGGRRQSIITLRNTRAHFVFGCSETHTMTADSEIRTSTESMQNSRVLELGATLVC